MGGDLGDAQKKRDLLERALRIKEREYGAEHREVAITLANLGNAYGYLGDAQKKRDLLERAYKIFLSERHPLAETIKKWLAEPTNGSGSGARGGTRCCAD